MAAALNYTFEFTDTGGGGLGPYTVLVRKNPTFPSGGTTLLTDLNATGTKNPIELSSEAQGFMTDSIGAANQSDSFN